MSFHVICSSKIVLFTVRKQLQILVYETVLSVICSKWLTLYPIKAALAVIVVYFSAFPKLMYMKTKQYEQSFQSET